MKQNLYYTPENKTNSFLATFELVDNRNWEEFSVRIKGDLFYTVEGFENGDYEPALLENIEFVSYKSNEISKPDKLIATENKLNNDYPNSNVWNLLKENFYN